MSDFALPRASLAETVGVSRSAISRKAVEASAEQLKQFQERRWENVEILVIYIDGRRFGDYHILSAVGVDAEGKKHILGIESGATENAASVKRLLTRLPDQVLPTERKYLFVIDVAKALRAAIEEVFGGDQPVQRCRNHKLRNVVDELPKEQQGQAHNRPIFPGRLLLPGGPWVPESYNVIGCVVVLATTLGFTYASPGLPQE